MNIKAYFKSQLKRALLLFPSVLLITAITLGCIAVTAFTIAQKNSNSEDKKRITIGLVGNSDDRYLNVGIQALKNMDDTRYSIEFKDMEKDEAERSLEKRQISGYIFIPEDFIDDIKYGINTPAQYRTLKNRQGFSEILMNEVALIISDIVTEAQNGSYSAHAVVDEYKIKGATWRKMVKLDAKYIKYALERHDTYKLEYIGMKDRLSFGGYYVCGLFVFFLLVWGISCNKVLSVKNYGLSRLLRGRGVKTTYQVFCEYASFFIISLLVILLLAVVFGIVCYYNSFGIRELENIDVLTAVAFVVKAIPVIAMITMMHMMIYEIFTGTVSAILMQFIISICLGYISGCFYPNSFFPESIQTLVEYLPSGAAFSYIRKAMTDASFVKELIMSSVYFIVFSGITVAVRNHRITGDRI